MLFECPSSRQETAMAERSRKSRPTAGLCATQRGADELRRRSTNSSPMNEGEIFRCAKPRELGKRGKNFATGEPHSLPLSRPSRACPEMAPQRLEKIESAPENGMVSEASKPQHLVYGRVAHRALRRNNLGAPPTSQRPQFTNSKRRKAKGNFPPRNPLESLKTGMESRRRLRLSGHGLRIRRARRPREEKLQKKAPNVLKSHDAELKSAEADRRLAMRFGRRRMPIR